MKKLLTLLVVLLIGCASTHEVMLPSGNTGYVVNCSGVNVTQCFEKMAETCPNGYDVIAYDQSHGAATAMQVLPGMYQTVHRIEKNYIIQCR